jgi:hypothetical protein
MRYKFLVSSFFIRIIFLFFLLTFPLHSQDPEQSVININNITSWIGNNGFHPWDMVAEGWNGSFPKGTPAGVIFSEGVVWGGKVLDGNDPIIRVSGSTYFNGNVPVTRLFRVRTHYKIEYLRDDAANFFLVSPEEVTEAMIEKIYAQYEKDWNEWPAEKGAPFYDKNKNGIYEPDIDIPGVPGSSQTIWIHYNDALSLQSYGSPPIGLEVQETYWAYTYTTLENVVYKQAKIIYKGTESSTPDAYIDSMYLVQWVDTDLGEYIDDFLGCDTLLNLGYTYNSKSSDGFYSQYLPAPPTAGFVFLQGVAQRTGNQSDSAVVNFKWRRGYRYFHSKPMTTFLAKRTAGGWSDPDGQNPEGTLQFYNLMRGYLPRPPYPSSGVLYNQYGADLGGFGTYNLTGDPITQTGWVDGIFEGPGDRRMFLITGPFTLEKNDTAEIVLALVGAIGNSYLGNITLLKYNAKVAAFAYDIFLDQMTYGNIELPPPQSPPQQTGPDNYVLYQNYPNPFNASTIIKYDLPDPAYIKLVVYDVLGREIIRLVDEEKNAGSYIAEFSGEGLPSGVYFYRITFNNLTSKLVYDNLKKTRKLLLIK